MNPNDTTTPSVATPAGTSQKIIIVEDNASLAEIYKTRLELLGYTVFMAYNGITALYFIQQERPDLVLLDLMVPDIAGDQILAKMRSSTWGKDIPVFIISNLNEENAPAGLRELGISGYAVKMNLANDDIDKIVNDILRPTDGPAPAAAPSAPAPTVAATPVHEAPEQPAPSSVEVPASGTQPPTTPTVA